MQKIIIYPYAILFIIFGMLQACDLNLGGKSVPDPIKVKAGEALAKNGREGIVACVSCHGINGEGNSALGYPRLAGLHAKYVQKQLKDFQRDPLEMGVSIEPVARDYSKTPRIYKDLTVYSPGTRYDASMNSMARALTDAEIENLSVYYSSLAFEATPVAADFQSLERGLDLAERGKPEYMLPRCDACHGPRGEGFGEHFPPLAGQPQQYIISQINKWQSGERDNDAMSMMKNTANMLTDGDKINIAKYYANQSYKVNME
jgi:cytochrome c553